MCMQSYVEIIGKSDNGCRSSNKISTNAKVKCQRKNEYNLSSNIIFTWKLISTNNENEKVIYSNGIQKRI